MNRGIAQYTLEVGEVNVLRGHSSLVPHKRQVPLSEFFQGEWLDGWGWQQPFMGFFSSINQALFRVSLVRGLGGLKPLMAQYIEVRYPPHVATLIEPLR